MERSNLSISKIIKEKWKCSTNFRSEYYQCEVSWAVKNYACSFCKRQFKSAQALGGHMNVHRRERARLRLLPPSLPADCSNPNLNPNLSSLSPSSPTLSSAKFLPHHDYKPPQYSLLSPPLTNALSSPASSSNPTYNDKKSIFDFPLRNYVPLSPQIRDRTSASTTTSNSMMSSVLEDEDHSKRFQQKDYFKALKTQKIIRLDLEMGLLKDEKEDVDLELRLGYL